MLVKKHEFVHLNKQKINKNDIYLTTLLLCDENTKQTKTCFAQIQIINCPVIVFQENYYSY